MIDSNICPDHTTAQPHDRLANKYEIRIENLTMTLGYRKMVFAKESEG